MSQIDTQITRWNLQLNTCQKQPATTTSTVTFVEDVTCGSAGAGALTSGAGLITYVGRDYVVCNGVQIYLGSCSNRVYAAGHTNFHVNDRINFDIVQSNYGKVWARKVACK